MFCSKKFLRSVNEKMRVAIIPVLLALGLGTFWSGSVLAEEPQLTVPAYVVSSNPLSRDPEAIDLGKRLYFTWCVQCHGYKANGESRFGEYAGDLTKFWRGYDEFVVIVKEGRPKKMMPPWKEVLDEDAIAKIGAYLETLAVEGANWQ